MPMIMLGVSYVCSDLMLQYLKVTSTVLRKPDFPCFHISAGGYLRQKQGAVEPDVL